MANAEIVVGTLDHARELAKDIRFPDACEIFASGGWVNAYDCIKFLFSMGGNAYTGLVDGKVACMLGAYRHTQMSTKGVPWLLTTHVVNEHPKVFLRYTKQGMEEIKQTWGFTVLENYVDVRHHEAIRWLKWLGFTIHPAQPHGIMGLPFHRFEMRIN